MKVYNTTFRQMIKSKRGILQHILDKRAIIRKPEGESNNSD